MSTYFVLCEWLTSISIIVNPNPHTLKSDCRTRILLFWFGVADKREGWQLADVVEFADATDGGELLGWQTYGESCKSARDLSVSASSHNADVANLTDCPIDVAFV